MARKILIDTDPGIDDAMAIFAALASPELDVIGLTTIFGNAATDVTTRNAVTLLDIADRGDIPVAAGRSAPIASDYIGPVPFVHGDNGLGDAPLSPAASGPLKASASDFIAASLADHPGEVTLTTDEWPIRVETESFSRGKTWPNLANTDNAAPPAWRGRPTVKVCTGVDGPRVAAIVEDRLIRATRDGDDRRVSSCRGAA